MKYRNGWLGMVVAVAASFAGCAVCDTCDDFPTPCTGPNCGHNGMHGDMGGQALPVMGSATPVVNGMDDSAGPGPMMPAPSTMPAMPPASM